MRAIAGDPVAIDFVDVWPEGVVARGRSRSTGGLTATRVLPSDGTTCRTIRPTARRSGSSPIDASIELEFPSPYLLNAPTVLRVARLAGDDRADTFFRSVTEAFEQELLAFHALVVDGTPPRAGLAEGRADIVTSQRVAERLASQRGSRSGPNCRRRREGRRPPLCAASPRLRHVRVVRAGHRPAVARQRVEVERVVGGRCRERVVAIGDEDDLSVAHGPHGVTGRPAAFRTAVETLEGPRLRPRNR